MHSKALILTLALSSPLPAAVFRLPVLFEDVAGARVTARRAELLAQVPTTNGQGYVVVDGRRPTRCSCDPGKGGQAPVAASSSGSTCCARQAGDESQPGSSGSSFLRYDFHVPRAGLYQVFVRVALSPGKSRFVETLDGRRYTGPFHEESSEEHQVTKWVTRPKVRLAAGLHRLSLASAGYQMPGIVSIVLATESTAPPNGEPPVAAFHEVGPLEIRTLPLHLSGLRAVKRLHGTSQGLLMHWSTFGAANKPGQWHALPPDTLVVDKPVRFKTTLDAAQPAVGPLVAEVEVDRDAVIQLTQDGVSLLLDGRTGDFLLLYDTARDTLLAGDGKRQSLIALQFKKAGQALWTQVGPDRTLTLKKKTKYALGDWHLETAQETERVVVPEAVVRREDTVEVRHLLNAEGLGRARVTQRIAPVGAGVWRLAVTVEMLEGPADVVGVLFPQIPAVRIGASGLDDVQLRMMSFGHRIVQPGRQSLHDASYCGRVVMNWTQIYDAQRSLYLGVHDPQGTTTVHGSRTSGPEGEAVGLYTRRLDEIRPGEKVTWETRLAIGNGGWHRGARLYGDWFTSVHGPADYPDWLRTSPGWLDLQAENYGPSFRFEQLPDWLTRARAIGFDWIQVWGQFAYDGGPCCSAWYGPSPLYGGAEAWRRAASEVKRRGGHIGGYFIYDRFDKLPVWTDTFLGHFDKSAYYDAGPWDTADFQHAVAVVTDPAGIVPPLQPSEDELAGYRAKVAEHRQLYEQGQRASPVQWWQTAYIPDPRWRDYLADWIGNRYVGQWGNNTCYIDVLGTGRATIDYDLRRGNNGDGSWGMGRKLLAEQVVTQARQHDRQFGLSMEGLGDLPGLHAAAMCSGVYRGNRNVVRYAFPDRVLIHGMANSGGHGTGGPMERFLATFREGMRWDIVGRPTALPVALLNLVRPFLPELYLARFLDTQGLKTSDPQIQARRFDATRTRLKCHLITLTNRDRLAGEVRLTDPALTAAGRILGLTLDGRILSSSKPNDDGSLTLAVDSTVLAAVCLVPQPDTPEAPIWPVLWADWSQVSRPGDSGPVTLFLFNLTGKTRSTTVDLCCQGYTEPYGERLPAAAAVRYQRSVTVNAGPATTVRFAASEPTISAWRAWTTRWMLSLSDKGPVRELLLTPLLLDPSFEFLDPGQGKGVDGRALELGPTTEGFQHRLLDLWLLPSHRYRLSLQAKRTGFQADVRGVLLRLSRAAHIHQDHRWALDRKRPNVWQPLGGELVTPPELTRAALYLYNVRSPATAWFDDIHIEDLGPE